MMEVVFIITYRLSYENKLVSQQKTSGEGDSLQSMTKRSLAKRPNDTKTDIDSILSSLSLGINIPQPRYVVYTYVQRIIPLIM